MEWPSGRDDAAVWGLAEVGRRGGAVAGADMGLLAIVGDRRIERGELSVGVVTRGDSMRMVGRTVYSSNPCPTDPGTKIGGAGISKAQDSLESPNPPSCLYPLSSRTRDGTRTHLAECSQHHFPHTSQL